MIYCRLNGFRLQNPRGANAVMVKLIDSETLTGPLDEMDSNPTIDITSVEFLGKYLEVAVDKIVGPPSQAHVDIARADYFENRPYVHKW